MASIIIGCFPAQGHVMPLLEVARHFAGRGDDVRMVTGSRFAEKVRATGATHVPLPTEADWDDRQNLNERYPERARLKGLKAVRFDAEHVFMGPGRHQYDLVRVLDAARPSDLWIFDPGFVGGAYLASVPWTARPPIIVCGITIVVLPSPDVPPLLLGLKPWPWRWANRSRNRALNAMGERIMAPLEVAADRVHTEIHGIPMPGTTMTWMSRAEAYAQFTVPEFEYPRSDMPATLRFLGPMSATGSNAPKPAWWGDLDGSQPVVHVTQGTFANGDYTQLIAPTLEALSNEDVLVVVATGGRPVNTLTPLPANARAAEMLPYDELLPKTSVFVTNGGYGGVHFALRYGVPIVATGGKEDKLEVGARIAWTGVGRRFRSERPTPAQLRRAVLTVLGDPRYRQAAARFSERIDRAPGLGGMERLADELIASSPRPGQAIPQPGPGGEP